MNNLNGAESYRRLKAQVLSEIKLGRLGAAFKVILENLDSILDDDLNKALLLVCYDYNKFKRDDINRLLSKDESDIQQNKIISRIVDLFKNYENKQYILQKIENKHTVGGLHVDSG